MKNINLFKIVILALGGAALAWAGTSIKAGDTLPVKSAAIRVTTGNTFALVPTDNPYVFGHPVDGVAQVSLMGNCHFHGEGEVRLPASPGQPIVIASTSPWTLTASNGTNSLSFVFLGTATFDPVNPNFANLTYDATFVGGTGDFAGATGTATFEVTAEFTSPLSGLANWTMKGVVITPPAGK